MNDTYPNFRMWAKGFLGFVALTAIFSCNSLERCREEMMASGPLADSLFLAMDSARFHKIARTTSEAAKCVTEHAKAVPADRLEAELMAGRMKQLTDCWGCHRRIHEMEGFYMVWMERSESMSEEEWRRAREVWEGLVESIEASELPCTEEDESKLLVMQSKLSILDVVGEEWQPLLEELENEMQDSLEELNGLLEEWLSE